jgi:hypothetical protein
MKLLKRCLNCYLERFYVNVALLTYGRLAPPLSYRHHCIQQHLKLAPSRYLATTETFFSV